MAHDLTIELAQDQINGQLYERADLVREYAVTTLNPAEATALVRYRDDIVHRHVLDLGCGAGRLATYLRPLTDGYVGMDISPHMLAHCRRAFPGLRFVEEDMRALPFGAGSFDSVFAIFNIFDAVSHADRLRVLAEVRRVLTQGGLLVFSSHNRNYSQAGAGPRLALQRNPITCLRCLAGYFRACSNHRRIKTNHRFESDYALLNDSGHNYSMLHYYVSRAAQAAQLTGAGFRLLESLDELGRTLGPGDDDSPYSTIHYVARSL